MLLSGEEHISNMDPSDMLTRLRQLLGTQVDAVFPKGALLSQTAAHAKQRYWHQGAAATKRSPSC